MIGVASVLAASAQDAGMSDADLLAAHLKQREARAKEVQEQLEAVDQRISKRIDELVAFIKRVKDSKESGNRVIQLKQHVIDALLGNAEDYEYMQNWLRSDLEKTKPAFAKHLVTEDVKLMEDRINKRLKQAVEVAGSLESRKDLPRYKTVRGSRWGWGSERIKNPAYRHNRQVGVRSELEVNQMAEALEKHIKDMRNRKRELELRREEARDEGMRELLGEDIRRADASIAAREALLAELAGKKPKPGPDALSRSRTQLVEHAVEDLVLDIESDEQKLFDLYHEYLLQQWQVFDLRERLAAAKGRE